MKETRAERLKFIGEPAFEPRPFFPARTAAASEHPSHLHKGAEETPQPPRVFHIQGAVETFVIYRLLDQSGRLKLALAEDSPPGFRAGFEGIKMNECQDRMIFIRMGENFSQRESRTLLQAPWLCNLAVRTRVASKSSPCLQLR